jgi:hypothetical protein
MKSMNRRAFFKALGMVGGAALAVAKLPAAMFARPMTVGGINQATFKFWRNQGPTSPRDFDALTLSMRDVYNRCEKERP